MKHDIKTHCSHQNIRNWGETESYQIPVAQCGGSTSGETMMRGHSLGTTCSEQKGWQPRA